jgi:dephospho-CoA kinase
MQLTKLSSVITQPSVKVSAQVDRLLDAFRSSTDVYEKPLEFFLTQHRLPESELVQQKWYQNLTLEEFAPKAIREAFQRAGQTREKFFASNFDEQLALEGFLVNLPEICEIFEADVAETANQLLTTHQPKRLKVLYTSFRYDADLDEIRQQLKKQLSRKEPFYAESTISNSQTIHTNLQRFDAICEALQKSADAPSRAMVCDAMQNEELQRSIHEISPDFETYAKMTIDFAKSQMPPSIEVSHAR